MNCTLSNGKHSVTLNIGDVYTMAECIQKYIDDIQMNIECAPLDDYEVKDMKGLIKEYQPALNKLNAFLRKAGKDD